MVPFLKISLSATGLLAALSLSARADSALASATGFNAVEQRAEAASGDKAEPKRHPLKGVIVEVLADKQALLVKHEAIPGVMRAMTMQLKTDAETLQTVKQGQAITALLVRKADGWWIESVKPAN